MTSNAIAEPPPGWLRALTECGHDAGDDDDERRQKSVITGASLFKAGVCPIWMTMFLAVGAYAAAIVPLFYALFTGMSIARLARNKELGGFRTRQTWLIFLLPMAVTLTIGGLQASSAVLLWSFLAPIIALLFHGPRSALRWLVGFFALVVVALLVEVLELLPVVEISPAMRSVFTAMNVIAVAGISYTAVRYYALLLEEERARQVKLNEQLAGTNAELDRKNRELAEQSRRLEESQQALVHSEKLAAIGQLVAGVAHELNTPLGAVRASVGNIHGAMGALWTELPATLARASESELSTLKQLIARATASRSESTSREERRLRRALRAELEADGCADAAHAADALVQLGVSGLDECDGIHRSPRFGELLQVAYDLASIERNCATIGIAADRAAKIVFALKTYAHPGSDNARTPASIAENLETVLTLYHNRIKHGVRVVRAFDPEIVVEGDHDELNQVWTNLVHNALDAMRYQGRLELRLDADAERARVQVIDDGPGIPEAIQPRIFEPFFTTKAAGAGTGLGLSISRDIVEKHKGTIGVESRPGRTVFTVEIPLAAT